MKRKKKEEEEIIGTTVSASGYTANFAFITGYKALVLESVSKSLRGIVGRAHTRAIRLAGRPRFE